MWGRTQLSSQFSPKIRICLRCNMKHSEECFNTYPNTSKCVKKTRLRLVFSTHFEVFGYVMKHSSECFIYYIKQILISVVDCYTQAFLSPRREIDCAIFWTPVGHSNHWETLKTQVPKNESYDEYTGSYVRHIFLGIF